MSIFGHARWKGWREALTPEQQRLAYNCCIESLKNHEYPILKGITYLDHGGTTLASKSLLESFCKEMQATLLANPHSDASNPSASTIIVAETRRKVLQFFNANPDHFDVVFTANATAAVKLVMECLSGHEEGFDFCFHRNCHTSVVGVREVARRSHCFVSDEETEKWLDGEHSVLGPYGGGRSMLFAYSAQSNMNGQRLPMEWASRMRGIESHQNTYTLLDAAALVSTSPLNLSNHDAAPDFITLSFYKIFGFPDLGALIVRKASAHVLDTRKYFGGGTTEMTTCFGESPWVARKQESIHARMEDGTIAIRSVLALKCAIDTHRQLFGGIDAVSSHTSWLAKKLHSRLSVMQHDNGVPICCVYKAPGSSYDDRTTQGATIAFNIRGSDGLWVGPYGVGAVLRAHNIHVRTGSLCNPGGMACALDLSPTDIRRAYEEGFRCNQQEDVRESGVIFGMVRVTFGAMSTLRDVEVLEKFVQDHFVDHCCGAQTSPVMSWSKSNETDREKSPSMLSKEESSPKRKARSIRTAFLGCFGKVRRKDCCDR